MRRRNVNKLWRGQSSCNTVCKLATKYCIKDFPDLEIPRSTDSPKAYNNKKMKNTLIEIFRAIGTNYINKHNKAKNPNCSEAY